MSVRLTKIRLLIAAALTVPCFGASQAAEAFWLFRHNESHSQAQNDKTWQRQEYNSQGAAYTQRINNVPNGHRLVPTYPSNGGTASKSANKSESKINDQAILKTNTLLNAENLKNEGILSNDAVSNMILSQPNLPYVRKTVAIGLIFNQENVKLGALDGAELIDNANNQIIARLPAQSQWILSLQNRRLALRPDTNYYLALRQLASSIRFADKTLPAAYSNTAIPSSSISFPSMLYQNVSANKILDIANNAGYTLRSATDENGNKGLLSLNDKIYRGDFAIGINMGQAAGDCRNNSGLTLINKVDLEDYLLSVVPSEMPSSWPIEALKAQAIAARSYAIANLGKHGSSGYDLKDNIEDQVYLGVCSESDATNEAVASTKGLLLRYKGKPVCAYFHSCSGGGTEKAEHVWHSNVPYLKAVIDFDQEAPLYSWTRNYSVSQAENGFPKEIGQILSINILDRSPSGRAKYILVNGTAGSRIISGELGRKYFNLPSTNFNVTPVESAYIFAGKGFGHGLGLSQWGAKALAQHGYNAAQILCYYYDGISIGY